MRAKSRASATAGERDTPRGGVSRAAIDMPPPKNGRRYGGSHAIMRWF